MIVDDERAIRENLAKAIPFEEYGFSVCTTAVNGMQALEKLPEVQPDLIMLDVCMPIMDGLGFLQELRKSEYKDTMVIMLSGYSDFQYAQKAMRFGVRAYLTKPIEEEEIIPLLEEVSRELLQYQKEKNRGTIREYIYELEKMYKGGEEERDFFKDFYLMHTVVMSMQTAFEEENPYHVLHECIEQELDRYGNCIFQSRGAIYTYLLPKKILAEYEQSIGLFARHLLHQLKNNHMECVLLFDTFIFEYPETIFRQDYANHLYQMLTDVFYGERGYIEYSIELSRKNCKKLYGEEQFIEKLKKNLAELNKEALEQEWILLTTEIQKLHLQIEYLYEINYRIYYLLVELMSSKQAEDEEPIIQPPKWREYPFFSTFEKWKERQNNQIMEVLSFMEKSKKLSNLGICKEIVEYVHRHYREPISLKQVADLYFVNAVYLGRVFQKATGVGFKQYVNDLRIAEAKRLLTQTDKLIYEIANLVGYTESKYFVAKFTTEVGISPSEYRRG